MDIMFVEFLPADVRKMCISLSWTPIDSPSGLSVFLQTYLLLLGVQLATLVLPMALAPTEV